MYPKGLVFTKDNQLVFVDGSTLRMVDNGGKTVRTLAGEREGEACITVFFAASGWIIFFSYSFEVSNKMA